MFDVVRYLHTNFKLFCAFKHFFFEHSKIIKRRITLHNAVFWSPAFGVGCFKSGEVAAKQRCCFCAMSAADVPPNGNTKRLLSGGLGSKRKTAPIHAPSQEKSISIASSDDDYADLLSLYVQALNFVGNCVCVFFV